MITPQNHSSSRCMATGVQVHHVPFEQIHGTVFVCPCSPCWIPAPRESGENSFLMGSYPEIFMGRGEAVLSVYIGMKDLQGQKLFSEDGNYPLYLPLDMLLGKKEGDTLEIVCKDKGKVLKLTCCQKNSRYKDLAKSFEAIVEDAFMEAYGKLFDKYQKGSLLEHELSCWKVISEMKRKYYPNVMVKI